MSQPRFALDDATLSPPPRDDASPATARWPGWRRRLVGLRLFLHARGRGEAARVRGFYRWWVWEEQRRAHGLAHVVGYGLKAPFRSWRQARRAVERYGGSVAREYGVSRRRQLLQLWWSNLWYGYDTDTYYCFQLYRPERWRRRAAYAESNHVTRLCIFSNRVTSRGEAPMINDKVRFAAWCREHGLPAVGTLVRFAGGGIVEDARQGPGLPATSLFSKPTTEWGGTGVMRWSHIGDRRYRAADGRERDADALLAELARESADHPILLQMALQPHPALAPLAGGGLCTVRMVTTRPPAGGMPVLEGALLRMPDEGSHTDNFSQGGMAAVVDVATGRLGEGIRQAPDLCVRPIVRHPASGTRFADVTLPFWDEAVRLVLRAHALLPHLPVVGWDVCILPDGVALMEGNANPGVQMIQSTDGRPLADTGWLPALNAHLWTLFTSGTGVTGAQRVRES